MFFSLEARPPGVNGARLRPHAGLLVAEGVVAAVLEAGYGDFGFDVASLDYWADGLDLAERLWPVFYAKAGDRRGKECTTRRIAQLLD